MKGNDWLGVYGLETDRWAKKISSHIEGHNLGVMYVMTVTAANDGGWTFSRGAWDQYFFDMFITDEVMLGEWRDRR